MTATRFGVYGGQYVPETLMPALEELETAFATAQTDPAFQDEFGAMLRDYVGRPSRLTAAPRFGERLGTDVWLKREDLNHTGAHKINNTVGQVAARAADGEDSGSSPKPGQGSTASPRPRSARATAWNASSTWARRTCGGRR